MNLLQMLRSFVLKASSHRSLFYTTVAAHCYVNTCEYYALGADVYNSCFMWIRVVAMWRAYTYGKIGWLRPQACTCKLFQNREIVSLPSYAS